MKLGGFNRVSAIILAGFVYTASGLAAVVPPTPLKNFQEVENSVYRGAQPDRAGFRALAQLGVHTIIDLRGSGDRSDRESQIVSGLGMKYVSFPLDGYKAPTADQVAKLLAIMEDASSGPVFIHCRRGADRTGTILAAYRIQHDHWENQKALDEAKTMKMASSEHAMRDFILSFKPAEPAVSQ